MKYDLAGSNRLEHSTTKATKARWPKNRALIRLVVQRI
jgi:hypothetical protein